MNNYLKLFLKLEEIPPHNWLLSSKAQELGIFDNELERLEEERYIFLEKIQKPSFTGYGLKLAPKGFTLLEEHKKSERDKLLVDSTIILMQVAIIGIAITLYKTLKENLNVNIFNPSVNIPWLLSVVLLFIFIAFSLLLFYKLIGIVFSKIAWKGILFIE